MLRLAFLRWIYRHKCTPNWLRRRVRRAYFDAWADEIGGR